MHAYIAGAGSGREAEPGGRLGRVHPGGPRVLGRFGGGRHQEREPRHLAVRAVEGSLVNGFNTVDAAKIANIVNTVLSTMATL